MAKLIKKEKSCGAIVTKIIDSKTKILLIKHTNGGHWAFPKGHVEKNETEEETALREIFEETGIVAELDTNFREVCSYSPKKNVIKDVVYFGAHVIDGKVSAQKGEVEEIKWLGKKKALELISFEADKKILVSYIDYLKQRKNKKI